MTASSSSYSLPLSICWIELAVFHDESYGGVRMSFPESDRLTGVRELRFPPKATSSLARLGAQSSAVTASAPFLNLTPAPARDERQAQTVSISGTRPRSSQH